MQLFISELIRFLNRRAMRIIFVLATAATVLFGLITFLNSSSHVPVDRPQDKEQGCRQAATSFDPSSDIRSATSTASSVTSPTNPLTPDQQSIYNSCLSSLSYEAIANDQRFCLGSLIANDICPTALTLSRIDQANQGIQPTLNATSEYWISLQEVREKQVVGLQFDNDLDQKRAPLFGANGMLLAFGLCAFMLSTILGATFVGADFKAGTIESLLVVEPRRLKVFATKAVALGVGTAAFVTASFGVFLAAVQPAAIFHGNNTAHFTDLWSQVGWMGLRVLVISVLFAELAFALTSLGKNTVAGVAIVLGWAAVSQVLAATVLKRVSHWELFSNAVAVISGGEVGISRKSGPMEWTEFHHDAVAALGVVAIVVAVVMVVAAAAFVRRDVD